MFVPFFRQIFIFFGRIKKTFAILPIAKVLLPYTVPTTEHNAVMTIIGDACAPSYSLLPFYNILFWGRCQVVL
jgi:hypothetical protein